MSESISITSLNVNGLGTMEKLREVTEMIKSEIICLQETGWTDDLMTDVKTLWNGHNLRSDQSREALAQIMNTEDLVDVWREEHPEVRDFSRRQIVLVTLKQSRIDCV